jgi:hypothetical protein
MQHQGEPDKLAAARVESHGSTAKGYRCTRIKALTLQPITGHSFCTASTTSVSSGAKSSTKDRKKCRIGTGEANIFRSFQAGIEIFKSIDAGQHFTGMGLADTLPIARIVVHPTNPEIVYPAAEAPGDRRACRDPNLL